jgi:hypothetical protein
MNWYFLAPFIFGGVASVIYYGLSKWLEECKHVIHPGTTVCLRCKKPI